MLKNVLKKMSVVLMVVGLSCITLTGCGTDLDAANKSVYLTAQESVNEFLIAPSTAEYEEWNHDMMEAKGFVLEDLGEGQPLEYKLIAYSGYVDSENEYGVMIRNTFTVDVYEYRDSRQTEHFGGVGLNTGIQNHVYCHVIAFN